MMIKQTHVIWTGWKLEYFTWIWNSSNPTRTGLDFPSLTLLQVIVLIIIILCVWWEFDSAMFPPLIIMTDSHLGNHNDDDDNDSDTTKEVSCPQVKIYLCVCVQLMGICWATITTMMMIEPRKSFALKWDYLCVWWEFDWFPPGGNTTGVNVLGNHKSNDDDKT